MRECRSVDVSTSAQALNLFQNRLFFIGSAGLERIVRLRLRDLGRVNTVKCEPRRGLGINGFVSDSRFLKIGSVHFFKWLQGGNTHDTGHGQFKRSMLVVVPVCNAL
jgi:hypothetical protein